MAREQSRQHRGWSQSTAAQSCPIPIGHSVNGATMTANDGLERGRESFRRNAWGSAYAGLSAAERERPLEPEDLELLAMSAYLVGKDTESTGAWARAHRERLARGETQRAARCAFWLALQLLNADEFATAGGWLARAKRLLDDEPNDCVEQGYVIVPAALQLLEEGNAAAAHTLFGEATEIGRRFGDSDLMGLGRLGGSQALIRLDRTAEGATQLDEVMVAVTNGELSAIVAGLVYCAVIEACQEIFDTRRAGQWTEALHQWCGSQPDLVPYRGQCLIHRSEIFQSHGQWADALTEAQLAYEQLSDPPGQPAIGAALYQLAELHRLTGESPIAEETYRRAHDLGRSAFPGLALLRLQQGRVDAAHAAIRGAIDGTWERLARCRLLPAAIPILLAAKDLDAAHVVSAELAEIAAALDAPFLRAISDHAQGVVALADDDLSEALHAARRAAVAFYELDAPYEAAQARVTMALACRRLGDDDTAELELDTSRRVFRRLGAAPDLARLDQLSAKQAAKGGTGGLTGREVEVLGLVATGKTNRAIAGELVISERTVARHISNIFTKLGLSSRSEATAYAFQHDLV